MSRKKKSVYKAVAQVEEHLDELEDEMISSSNDSNQAVRDTFTDEQKRILIDYLESIQEIEPPTEVAPDVQHLVSDLKNKAARVEQLLQNQVNSEENTMNAATVINPTINPAAVDTNVVTEEMISRVTRETFRTLFSNMDDAMLDAAIADVPKDIGNGAGMSDEDRRVLYPAAIELATKASMPGVTRAEKLDLLVEFSMKAKDAAETATKRASGNTAVNVVNIPENREKVVQFLAAQQAGSTVPPPPPAPVAASSQSTGSTSGGNSSWTLVEVGLAALGVVAVGGLAYWLYNKYSSAE